MKNKINIANLLRDCPSGMELDCLMYEDVYFDYVVEHNMIHCYIQHETYKTSIIFNQYGTTNSDIKSKCVIFPKGKTTWEGFVPPCKFKDGDIVVTKTSNNFIFYSIYKCVENREVQAYVDYNLDNNKLMFNDTLSSLCFIDEIVEQRLATEEEKEKLFQAIEDNGYEWNAETKTLEKLPKFKVGDIIIKRDSIVNSWIVSSVSSEYYGLKSPKGSEVIGVLPVAEQDDYELVSDIKPKFKVGDRVKDKNNRVWFVVQVSEKHFDISGVPNAEGYFVPIEDQDEYELVPNKFDITSLKPFDKVLVRGNVGQKWTIDFFGFIDNDKGLPFVCVGYYVTQCIPYEGNEHLIGTKNDCDDFYKTWEQ